ncbi:MAG TPA: site-specific DNA-methyltransferase [bacterium]|nr:site-specific DNA-methyltransferase [bacterium]
MQGKNVLYYGDNLEVLRLHVKDESVDLIYLDPPFKSDQNYNVLFAERNGTRSPAQIKAFKDTWTWDLEAAEAFEEVVERGGKVSEAMQGFRKLLGNSDMLAYISMMAPRLIELQRILKRTGSIYLHCDPTASAYLRLLMDAVFGPKNFRNEIVWCYSSMQTAKKTWAKKHDTLLYFSKSDHRIFNVQDVLEPYPDDYAARFKHRDEKGKYIIRAKGGPFAVGQGRLKPEDEAKYPQWTYRQYMKKGSLPKDWWVIQMLNANSPERLGYPTQKPEALLERIIKASSNEGDLVLDPFCGCGTTIAVAQRLNRRWIGIDAAQPAITLSISRFERTFGEIITRQYDVVGELDSISGNTMQPAEVNPTRLQKAAKSSYSLTVNRAARIERGQ